MPPKGWVQVRIPEGQEARAARVLSAAREKSPIVTHSMVTRAAYRLGLDALEKDPALVLLHGASSEPSVKG